LIFLLFWLHHCKNLQLDNVLFFTWVFLKINYIDIWNCFLIMEVVQLHVSIASKKCALFGCSFIMTVLCLDISTNVKNVSTLCVCFFPLIKLFKKWNNVISHIFDVIYHWDAA
jgi:hypothetical protein